MELVHEFDFRLRFADALAFGNRVFASLPEGEIVGERLNATLLPGSGDWNVIRSDGWSEIDVRAHLRTDDDAYIYLNYTGLLELSEPFSEAAAAGAASEWTDQYLRTTLRFETGDERYRWLCQSLFVAEGRLVEGGGIEYRVYRIT